MQPRQTLTIQTTDGVGLRAYQWGQPDQRPAIVLVHGFTSYSFWTWIESGAAAGLLASGRHVIALDLRGHGASDRPAAQAAFRANRMAQDVSEAVTALGLRRFHLAGYSLGGVLSLLVAARDTRVERLALCGCVQQVLRETATGPLAPVVAAAFREVEDGKVTHPLGRFFREIALRRGSHLETMALCIEGLETEPPDMAEVLAGWAGPTLLIGGRQDFWMTSVERLAGLFSNAAVVMTDGDHFTALNAPPMASTLAQFFALEGPAA